MSHSLSTILTRVVPGLFLDLPRIFRSFTSTIPKSRLDLALSGHSEKSNLQRAMSASDALPTPLDSWSLSKDLNRMTAKDVRWAIAACRTLIRLGYSWHGGEEWKPPLGKPPTFRPVTSESFPEWTPRDLTERYRDSAGMIEVRSIPNVELLRQAIGYALDTQNPDGLEWLRARNEGDVSAQTELMGWCARGNE